MSTCPQSPPRMYAGLYEETQAEHLEKNTHNDRDPIVVVE
jgi:hypothetical protein